MIKTNGKEFKEFMESEWPEGWYMDDTEFTFNGIPDDDNTKYEELDDNCIVKIISGYVVSETTDMEPKSLESFFKKWRKSLTVEYITVEIPKGRSGEVKEFIRSMERKK